MRLRTGIAAVFAIALSAAAVPPARAADAAPAPRTAPKLVNPDKAAILAATRAGKRIVAVGDYGAIILSDDGAKFRQAALVPTRAALTSVHFIDEQRGWAAGHDGTVIATTDGGERWQVLRETRGQDRVLLSVWFENPSHGFAVGQFGLMIETEDGGKTWRERRLIEAGEVGERHLFHIVPCKDGLVLVAAEAGTIFRSTDAGRNWTVVQTDNKGSFWTGMALADGSLIVAGLRGHIYRSADHGVTWRETPWSTQQSLTGMLQRADGAVRFVGLSGVSLLSKDGGQNFESKVRPDRIGITALAMGPAGEVLFTLSGVVADK